MSHFVGALAQAVEAKDIFRTWRCLCKVKAVKDEGAEGRLAVRQAGRPDWDFLSTS